MKEQFGNVTVTYEEGADRLENVHPEDAQIENLVEAGYDCRRGSNISWPVLYHLSHLRGNLTEWLPIREHETVLEFGADSGQLTGGFLKKAHGVLCLEESVSRSRILAKRYASVKNLEVRAGNIWKTLETLEEASFDWIIAPGLLSQAARYFPGDCPEEEALKKLKTRLSPGGHLVLAEDNRFGLKYWAGAMEPHTGRYFDSLEGRGTTFSKGELERILEKAGCGPVTFYYPYPERWFPASIYSDDWLPKRGELNKNLRNFEGERLVLFDEEKVYDQLIQEGRFPEFANTYLCVAGPAFEEKLLYTKYSNDRAEEFMIRTDIVECAGKKEVRKIPISEKAREHVEKMAGWEKVLGQQYEESGIQTNRCVMQNGAACFEFLEGRTYEEKLDELRAEKNYSGLAQAMQDYKKLLMAALWQERKPFAKSERFVEMFGNPEFSRAYEGAEINNLDWIFGNLMETEAGIQIIDYEWTFPVQVPVEYLIWRAVSLYLDSREELQNLGLMSQLHISAGEERIFEAMEHHFQLWLLQGTVTIGAQYMATAGKTVFLEDMLDTMKKNRIQVYVDRGEGFSEGESWWIDTEPDKRGVIHLELLLPEGAKAIRLDPAECTCLVKIKRLLGELGGTYPLEYTHNGRELEEQGILYTTEDPQITIPGLVEGTGRIYGELTVQELCPDTAYACMNLLNRVRTAERIYGSRPFRILKSLKRAFRK